MKKKICCIYDADERYAIRLMEAMNECENVPYRVYAYTDESAVIECSRQYEIAVMLVSEEADSNLISTIGPEHVFILSEEKTNMDERVICKYQSVDAIVKSLLAGLSDIGVKQNKSVITTVVYSPSDAFYNNILALKYVCEKSRTSKILYINLDEFSPLDYFFDKKDTGLSDALFYLLSDRENRITKITECIREQYGIDYLYPVDSPEDIGEVTPEILSSLVEIISSSGVYKEIVIEMGSLVTCPWIFMDECDRILIPKLDDGIFLSKENNFKEFLDKSKFKKLQEKIIKIQMDRIDGGNSITRELVDSLTIYPELRALTDE